MRRFLGPDSLRKLGPCFQFLSELVPKLGAVAITFSLNVQTCLCLSGTLVPRGLRTQRTVCTVNDSPCSCEHLKGPQHVLVRIVQKAPYTVRHGATSKGNVYYNTSHELERARTGSAYTRLHAPPQYVKPSRRHSKRGLKART